jgi:two-component sensor histidine kinase/HAMP domain-containing protein
MKSGQRSSGYPFGASRRIILQCILWYLVAVFAFSAVECATVSASVDREIEDRILSIEERIQPALVQAVWNLDRDLISLILDGVAADPAIRRVELRDTDGSTAASSAVRRSDSAWNDPAPGSDAASLRIFPLRYFSPGKPPRPIGELWVHSSDELRKARIRETVLFSLGRTALIALILTAILAVSIERGLGRPLRELARKIAQVDPVDPRRSRIDLDRSPSGELSLVADSFNAMAGKVGETMEALEESRARFWSAFEDSPIALWEEDFSAVKARVDEARAAGASDWRSYFADDARVAELRALIRIIDVNRATVALLGARDKREALGPLYDTIGDQALDALRAEFIALASGALSWEGDDTHSPPGGSPVSLHIRLVVVPGHESSWDRVLLSMQDVTERKNAERVLRSSLAEKELLLKEVHHRVKNNLQIICSLIGIQSGTADPDSETAAALADIESRVWSMALVHELLYESEDFAALDFPGYVRKLCDRVVSGFEDAPGRIRVDVDIRQEVRLVLEKAIPCGLLINELMVNSFKHAFPDGRRGTITVSMDREPDGTVSLRVADDGVGVADLAGARKPRSIGFTLVESLAAQLGGTVEFSGEGGFRSEFRFPG